MKQFAIILFATLAGVLAALLIHDRLIVQPREQRIALDLAQTRADSSAMAAAAQVDLSQTRAAASQITEAVDASVERSVSTARAAFDAQADELERRRLAADVLARAGQFKLALAESYMNHGEWPVTWERAGLGDPASYAGGAVSAIELGEQGRIVITLNGALAKGAKVDLVPTVHPNSGNIEWRCEVQGYDEFRRLVPACR